VNAKAREARILKRAKEIAATGDHIGWFYVAHALTGEPLALQVLEKEPNRSEIDAICGKATKRKWAAQRR